MQEELVKSAKEIIEKILYITIATVSADGQPWNTPVYSSYDKDYNFFWASHKEAQHSKNIKGTGKAFLAIYDSTVAEGTGEGVYIQAAAEELTMEEDIKHAIKYHYARKNQEPRDVSAFKGDSPRRFYRATPQKTWRNVDSKIDGHFVDKRIEIKLSE